MTKLLSNKEEKSNKNGESLFILNMTCSYLK